MAPKRPQRRLDAGASLGQPVTTFQVEGGVGETPELPGKFQEAQPFALGAHRYTDELKWKVKTNEIVEIIHTRHRNSKAKKS